MAFFWEKNNKKVRDDMENILKDKRYENNGNRLKGDDQESKLIANSINAILDSRKKK
jgi:hypothetical protein